MGRQSAVLICTSFTARSPTEASESKGLRLPGIREGYYFFIVVYSHSLLPHFSCRACMRLGVAFHFIIN